MGKLLFEGGDILRTSIRSQVELKLIRVFLVRVNGRYGPRNGVPLLDGSLGPVDSELLQRWFRVWIWIYAAVLHK